MDQNLPIIANKFWNIVRVAFFMLKKGISKRKFMLDFNLFMKRSKIASKTALHNLMFHHMTHQRSNSSSSAAPHVGDLSHAPPDEYEFSCSNSPAHPTFHLPFNFNLNKRSKHHAHHFHAPSTTDDDVFMMNAAVVKALEMLQNQNDNSSPANNLPGFGMTPTVRQLRVTDSPFPLRDVEDDSHVDEAAENFISKFYRDLRRQASPAAN